MKIKHARPASKTAKPVTIVLPVIAKDLTGLAHTVASLRKFLKHPIERIILVSPEDKDIARFARDNDAEHVLETNMLPANVLTINAHTQDARKIGWIRQQMIKMHANAYFKAQRVLTIDCDTVLIRDVAFETDSAQMILYKTEEYRPSYAQMTQNLLGYRPISKMNHVAHCMLFDRSCMEALKTAITEQHGKDWTEVIKQLVESETAGSLSEFELYAAFVNRNFADMFTSKYWYNRKVKPGITAQWASPPTEYEGYNFLSTHIH